MIAIHENDRGRKSQRRLAISRSHLFTLQLSSWQVKQIIQVSTIGKNTHCLILPDNHRISRPATNSVMSHDQILSHENPLISWTIPKLWILISSNLNFITQGPSRWQAKSLTAVCNNLRLVLRWDPGVRLLFSLVRIHRDKIISFWNLISSF